MSGTLLPKLHSPLDVALVMAASGESMAKMAHGPLQSAPTNWSDLTGMDKEAFVGALMRAGKGLAGRMAAGGGRTGAVGKKLLRPVRNPLRKAPVGKVAPAGAASKATPAATAGQAAGGKSLTGALAGPALLLGGAYAVAKGVPAAAQFATEASRRPMAHGLGFQQYAYGYPKSQAPF